MSTDIIPYSFKNSYIFFVNCLIYFETVPYLKNVGTQKFIEDKETLVKTAKQNGIAGIVKYK